MWCLAMISYGRIVVFDFGVKILLIYERLILFIALKISVAKVRNPLISIVVVPFFLIRFPQSLS